MAVAGQFRACCVRDGCGCGAGHATCQDANAERLAHLGQHIPCGGPAVNEAHGHYAYEIHGAAEEQHRHYDTESELRELRSLVAGLREDLRRAEDRIRGLEARRRRPGSSRWRPASPRPISPSPATTSTVAVVTARDATSPSRTSTTPGRRPMPAGSLRHN